MCKIKNAMFARFSFFFVEANLNVQQIELNDYCNLF